MKFTIITSTYNVADDLVHTAKSLAEQRCRDFQWIIADGASTDGTVDVARGFGSLVSTLDSTPDSGIYNAWNRVLPQIKGDWVLFLGAGDALADAGVLERASQCIANADPASTLVYGSVVMVEAPQELSGVVSDYTWGGLDGPWTLGRPKLPCHQGVFHRASLFSDGFRFDERLKICADSELLLREFCRGRGERIDLCVSRFLRGGISTRRLSRLRVVSECIFITMKIGIFWKRPIYQVAVLASNLGKYIIRRWTQT
jgi:hypothetical protein